MRVFGVAVAATLAAAVSMASAADPIVPRTNDYTRAPGPSEVKRLYPAAALAAGVEGRASALCRANSDGVFIDCTIESESPAGYGFGAAAVASAGLQALWPDARNRYGPDAIYRLRTIFDRRLAAIPDETRRSLSADESARAKRALMLNRDDWAMRDNPADWKAAFPKAGADAGLEGTASIICRLSSGAALTDCFAEWDNAPGYGFDSALITVAQKYRVTPEALRKYGEGAEVRLQGTFLKSYLTIPDTNPDWVRRPSANEVGAAFPLEALRQGVSGQATLACTVNIQGGLEGCKVEAEEPANMGFGQAALSLAPSFLMKPATLKGAAVASPMRIPVRFSTKGPIDPGRTESARVMRQPPFVAAPSYEDVLAAWPARTPAGLTEARAAMQCRVTFEGELANCTFTALSHPRQGFEQAGLELAKKFKFNMEGATRADVSRLYASAPIHFIHPSLAQPDRFITRGEWLVTPSPEQAAGAFPVAAVDAGLKTGTGRLECIVAPTGVLDQCKVLSEDPAGHWFGEAALKIASIMRLRVWTEAGMPTAGSRIRLPIRLDVAEPLTPAAR